MIGQKHLLVCQWHSTPEYNANADEIVLSMAFTNVAIIEFLLNDNDESDDDDCDDSSPMIEHISMLH